MSFSFPYSTKVENLRFGDVSLRIESLESLDQTIDEYFLEYQKSQREELFEDLCPYFGVPWPAGKALTSYVVREQKEFKGQSILELGCGLALPSFALARLGIAALCTDLHPDVPEFFRRNCEHNSVKNLRCELVDWRKWDRSNRWTRILASDVLYDRHQPEELLTFLDRHLEKTGIFYVTDPGRPYFDRFLHGVKVEKQWRVQEELYEEAFLLRIQKE